MKTEIITSVRNPKVKDILSLQDSKYRRETGLFVVEGYREIKLAMASGYDIKFFVRCAEMMNDHVFTDLTGESGRDKEVIEISKYVFEKLAYREDRDGLIVVAHSRKILINDLKLSGKPLILVLETVEKPGNLGAVLRTADAAKADAVIVCDPLTDVYNPNIIRSSLGCVFTNQVATGTSPQVAKWLKAQNIKIRSAVISEKSKPYDEINFNEPSAIVLGSEAHGLTDFWTGVSDDQVIIPMYGRIDSLNVSATGAILLFEALRQRRKTWFP